MIPKNYCNPSKTTYFSLEEYINRIELEKNLLEHLEETNNGFNEYFKAIMKCSDQSILYYWLDSLNNERKSTQLLENSHDIGIDIFNKDDIFFDTFRISHTRIKKLHQLSLKLNQIQNYRIKEVVVGYQNPYTKENVIYWRGAEAKDINKFMNDFLKIYKERNLLLIHSHPILKAALIFLLFVRIHPFLDGNGRTGRLLYNIKFTDIINQIYGLNLKINPLNISQSILLNQPTYVRKIDSIYFDLEHDYNAEINAWFEFILNMVDEQIYFHKHRLKDLQNSFVQINSLSNETTDPLVEALKRMKK